MVEAGLVAGIRHRRLGDVLFRVRVTVRVSKRLGLGLGLVPDLIGRKQGETLSVVGNSVTMWSRWGLLLV